MRALIVEDHPLMRDAVAGVLRRLDATVEVAVSGTCEEGLAAAEAAEPDLLLLDLNLPGMSGLHALAAWRTRFPLVPVIVLSAATDRAMMLAALDAGAAGYIPKASSSDVMLSAIRLVQAGGRYVPPEVLPRADGHDDGPARTQSGTPPARPPPLTARQMDVLRLLASGASNKVMSRELGLAERTVKAHVTAVFRALKVSSRTQAALAAARLGLADPERPRVRAGRVDPSG
ncbi:MAG: response regulator transcription factor [Burkholderiales bacterium]